MIEDLAFHIVFPCILRRVQQGNRTQHIRSDKSKGIGNAAVNMAFSSAMQNGIEFILLKK